MLERFRDLTSLDPFYTADDELLEFDRIEDKAEGDYTYGDLVEDLEEELPKGHGEPAACFATFQNSIWHEPDETIYVKENSLGEAGEEYKEIAQNSNRQDIATITVPFGAAGTSVFSIGAYLLSQDFPLGSKIQAAGAISTVLLTGAGIYCSRFYTPVVDAAEAVESLQDWHDHRVEELGHENYQIEIQGRRSFEMMAERHQDSEEVLVYDRSPEELLEDL